MRNIQIVDVRLDRQADLSEVTPERVDAMLVGLGLPAEVAQDLTLIYVTGSKNQILSSSDDLGIVRLTVGVKAGPLSPAGRLRLSLELAKILSFIGMCYKGELAETPQAAYAIIRKEAYALDATLFPTLGVGIPDDLSSL
jgi:hypothetical protein